jgi:hypothetical protein
MLRPRKPSHSVGQFTSSGPGACAVIPLMLLGRSTTHSDKPAKRQDARVPVCVARRVQCHLPDRTCVTRNCRPSSDCSDTCIHK